MGRGSHRLLLAACTATLCGVAAEAGRAEPRPNVLVLVIDTLRADYVGAFGGRARTPNMDRLARRGLRFTRFYNEAMATVPARRSIMAGRRVFPFRGWKDQPGLLNIPGWAPITDTRGAFTSVLRRHGYWTAHVSDNPFVADVRSFARFRRSFHRFANTRGHPTPAEIDAVTARAARRWLVPETRRPVHVKRMRHYIARTSAYFRDDARSTAARTYRTGAAMLARAARRQPFALMVDTFEPHEPWTPTQADIARYTDLPGPHPAFALYGPVGTWLSPDRAPDVLGRVRDLYAAEVTMTDRWLGVVLDRLDALGLTDSTIVVLTADHGHLLGDHGWTGKHPAILHPALIRTPFILADPRGRAAGKATTYYASTHDIGPTVLGMAGVRAPRRMNGVSLEPLLRGGRPPARGLAWGGYGNYFYARTERWALISTTRMQRQRLYDLRADPAERRDVAARHPRVVRRLADRVLALAGGRMPFHLQR